ncbi:MAG: translation elongation factor Ts [Rhodospirillales bacterium]
MTEITAAKVKDLREKTGAGMMDCKKALNETSGDLEQAVDWLRTKGLAAAAKKAGRVAADGLVGAVASGTAGALIEVNAETDFVARNEVFQDFVLTLAGLVLEHGDDLDALKTKPYPGTGRTVEEELTHQIVTIGENMTIRRARKVTAKSGVVAAYVHGALKPGAGKIGVLAAMETAGGGGDGEKLAALGKQISMHIAASAPEAVSADDLDSALIERERAIFTEQARESGKPDDIVAKMVEGRLRKYREEVCLLEQTYAIDGETKIAKVLETAKGDVGADVAVSAFARFKLGDGIEKKDEDFAAEVAKTLGS